PPPHVAPLQRSSGDVRLAVAVEIADFDIRPGDAGAPGVPLGSSKAGTGGQSDPPVAAFGIPAHDVGLAVAIEVADLHVRPGDAGAPGVPLGGSKAGTIRQG